MSDDAVIGEEDFLGKAQFVEEMKRRGFLQDRVLEAVSQLESLYIKKPESETLSDLGFYIPESGSSLFVDIPGFRVPILAAMVAAVIESPHPFPGFTEILEAAVPRILEDATADMRTAIDLSITFSMPNGHVFSLLGSPGKTAKEREAQITALQLEAGLSISAWGDALDDFFGMKDFGPHLMEKAESFFIFNLSSALFSVPDVDPDYFTSENMVSLLTRNLAEIANEPGRDDQPDIEFPGTDIMLEGEADGPDGVRSLMDDLTRLVHARHGADSVTARLWSRLKDQIEDAATSLQAGEKVNVPDFPRLAAPPKDPAKAKLKS